MKLKQNNKYTIIAIYAIVVFTVCLSIYKVVFNWIDVVVLVNSTVSILSPFISALMIAYFTSPMINFFEDSILNKVHIKNHRIKSLKLKRGLSIVMAYFVILGTISLLLSFVIPQVGDSISEISSRLQNIDQLADNASKWLTEKTFKIGDNSYRIDFEMLQGYVSEYIPSTLQQLTGMLKDFMPNIIDFTANLATWFKNLLLGFIIAIYLLFNKETYGKNTEKIFTALLPIRHIDGFFRTAKESHKIFTGFIVGKIIDSIIIGLLCFVLMAIFKIDYAVLISVIVGITNMIPYFGPFIGGIIGVIFILIVSPIRALWFAIIILGLQQFDGNILGPKILGESTGLTPVWVIFSVVTFGSLLGIMGMFIGVPCFAVIKNIFDHIIQRRYNIRMSQMNKDVLDSDPS